MRETRPFPDYFEARTYATIRKAYDACESKPPILEEHGYAGNANISSILTAVIQDTGRFAERFASDVLYTLDHLREIASEKFECDRPLDEVVLIGIRASGVDHNEFVMSRLLDTRRGPADYVYPDHVYRRILAIRVQITPGENRFSADVRFTLRDLTHEIIRIDPADLTEEGRIRETPLPQAQENDDDEKEDESACTGNPTT